MRRLLFPCLCLALLIVTVPSARADDSDIFVGASIQPNVMILFDSSGSMGDEILADPYDPNATYTGTYTSTKVYQWIDTTTCTGKGKNKVCTTTRGYFEYANTVGDVTDTKAANQADARNTLNTVGHWNGSIGGSSVDLYVGAYLNWTATPGNTMTRKIDIARTALKNIISATKNVRFGLAKFHKNDTQNQTGHGAMIIAAIGSDPSVLVTALDNISPNGYTPLGEALQDIGTYYNHGSVWDGTTSQTSPTKRTMANPIQFSCQVNYIILMSDGMQNGSVDVTSQATSRFNESRLVSTIGFALSPEEKALGATDTLQTAAKNGGGTYYETSGDKDLEKALQAAMRKIVQATFSFATPTIPTTSTTGNSRAYMAAFQSNPSGPFWRGYLKAFNRDVSGKVTMKADGKTPDDSPSCTFAPDPAHPETTIKCLEWEAGAVLAGTSPGSRTIYTKTSTTGTAMESFDTSINPTDLGLTSGDTATRNKIVNFIRGVDVYDENDNGNTTEDRAWKLGDIFHSTPVLVPPPFQATLDTGYAEFMNTSSVKNRPTIVLVGANDGMLHAFRESDGTELWAFIPTGMLGVLKTLTDTSQSHSFYVDGGPTVADVQIDGNWKTIVVFGLRRGGDDYYALDITDTANPRYLWSLVDTTGTTFSQIAESWSDPIIGKVKMDSSTGTTYKYVAMFGGGYDSAINNAHGAAFFVVDVKDGTELWKYYKAVGSTDDRQYMTYSIPSSPLALDLNSDGFIDRVYIGDVGGQLWKFDLSAPATLTGTTTGTVRDNVWKGKRFFRAGTDSNPPTAGKLPTEAIFATPNAALDSTGNLWIYFGTGDRDHPNNTTAQTSPTVIPANRFFGVKDKTDMTNGSTLTDASDTSGLASASSVTTAPSLGWYVSLGANEKVLASSNVFNQTVYFTTFIPTNTVACDTGGGNANLYAVQMTTAFAVVDWSSTEKVAYNADNPTDNTKARGTQIGVGIPSKPIVIITDSGVSVTTSVVAATTSQQLPTNPAPPPAFMRRILYWREAF